MRRREIAAYVWVHPPSRRTTVRIAEGGRKKLHQLHRCSQFYSVWRAISRAKQSTSAPRLSRRLGGYRERNAGRVSVMGRNAPDALGQQIITGRRMADVTQTDDADHPLALVHHRQPAELQLLHVMHRLCEVIVLPATMDAFSHHIARHRVASIEVVARKPFADDVAVGHHPDQSGLTQSTPLCITSLTFMADLRPWSFQVHLMRCSTAPVFSQPYNRSGATAPAPQGRRRKDYSYAIGTDGSTHSSRPMTVRGEVTLTIGRNQHPLWSKISMRGRSAAATPI
jgi:hypothetical protein